MSIVRDECNERQTLVDRMIDEFRKAQSRRLAKATPVTGDDPVVDSPRDAIRTFSISAIDYLVLGRTVVSSRVEL